MIYKYIEVKKVDNDIVVITNEEPKPIDGAWYVRPTYESVLKEWEGNNKTFKPSDKKQKEIIIDISQYNYIGNLGHLHPNWDTDIELGIEIKQNDYVKNYIVIKDGFAYTETKKEVKDKENLIDANDPKYLLGVLRNIERQMPKAWRKRTTNVVIVRDFLMIHTSKGGRTSSYEMCEFLGVDGDGYTFN
jgi:hypothetical protein